ncbi:MAG TPA: sulfatase [Candidatus Brocadiia bacterium]|nr:sulfatase [Candidatus Brocadiia bacterium]
MAQQRPNILYLHSHDTGRYIQPYGHAVPTPNLQALAEEGVLFRQCFCAGPTCSPSRAALLTGMCPHSNGMVGLAHRKFRMNDYSQHFVHTLRKAGYLTALSGVQHEAEKPETIGYDRILAPKGKELEPAIEFLRGQPAQPFFLSVGFGQTHRRFPEDHPLDDARYCLPPAPLPDTPQTREDMARFKASARELDARMGAVLDALRQSGLADHTIVVCTTDHGIAFPRMKCTLYDSGIGVMLIMRGPNGWSGGKVVDGMVSHVDLFPTLCELAGLEKPAWLQGVSFAPLVRGEHSDVREEVFAEVNYHAQYEPMRCARTKRWKYIVRYEERPGPALANCDDSPSKDVWVAHGWASRKPLMEELYDLVFDPHEARNLAGDPSAVSALAEMRERLRRWMEATDDPLLKGGPVPAPKGALVNRPDSVSPSDELKIVM